MKRTGCMLLCCLLLLCTGCSFQPDSASSGKSTATATDKTPSRSAPSVAPQTGEESGMPAVIDGSEIDIPQASGKEEAKPQGPYIGNVQSKVFHKADCESAEKMKEENKRAFSTRAEAFEAGFHPCSSCRP